MKNQISQDSELNTLKPKKQLSKSKVIERETKPSHVEQELAAEFKENEY